MGTSFTWVPIYKELAQKILQYRSDRKPLVDWIYSNLSDIRSGDKPLIGYLREENGDRIKDIDPFSVFAMFNRGLSDAKRNEFLRRLKAFFSLESAIPDDYNGIPVMNAMRSFFFSWGPDNHSVIETYWSILEKALSGKDFEAEFNSTVDRGGIKYSLSMALFWILPDKYISLDSNNRNYIKKAGISIDECPHYKEYLEIINSIKSSMAAGKLPHSTFMELSYQAWQDKPDESVGSDVWMWLADEEAFKSDRICMGKSVSSEIRDYSQFKTYAAMRNAYQKVKGNTDVSIPDAYWKFITQVKPGDYVVVFRNKRVGHNNHHILLGWGTFISELINDVDSESPLQRKVEWHTPMPAAPVEDALTRDSLFFHATTAKQADNIKNLLGIGTGQTMPVVDDSDDRSYWLVGYSYGDQGSQYERFIADGVWEGNGTKTVNDRIESFRKGDVLILKATSTKGKKHDRPFLRIKNVAVMVSEKAELLPDTNYSMRVKYLNIPEADFDGSKYGKYRQTVHSCDDRAIIDYVSQYLKEDGMEKKESKYQEYVKLLKNCRNLILTGAPGTGKSYMARELANEMGECEFVQFHPSFDYTDFVEGLRPVNDGNGQMGFERRDGIFKAFCKRALKNLRDSERSREEQKQSADINNRLSEFLNDAIDNERVFQTATGTKFSIVSFDNGSLSIIIPDNNKAKQLKVKLSQIADILENDVKLNKVYDVRDYFKQQFGTQQNSYIFVICNEVRKLKPIQSVSVVTEKRKDFVFVVDEINRGDLSKIFGELFFSLDPGYRGIKGAVKTQYQNLVEGDDVFAGGFYIPENVYLIGTMNDIDRSVESMDFAMRRRFTWKEVKPEDRIEMWEDASWKDEAAKRMTSLNDVISEIRGLGAEYSIGPSYFLKLDSNGADFDDLWEMNLKFLLGEYLRGFADKRELLDKLHKAYNLESE